jgi:hypothetical protein
MMILGSGAACRTVPMLHCSERKLGEVGREESGGRRLAPEHDYAARLSCSIIPLGGHEEVELLEGNYPEVVSAIAHRALPDH